MAAASALRVIFLPITLSTLFCCSISRDTLSGSESESTTPLMKPRYLGIAEGRGGGAGGGEGEGGG